MSTTVRPPDRLSGGAGPVDEDHYRLAVEEARAQAEALRHSVCRANDLVRQLEELVESLRAILLYPKAYDWPPVESEAEPSEGTPQAETVVEVTELDQPAKGPA
jgi:multidrug resistance efflux pump